MQQISSPTLSQLSEILYFVQMSHPNTPQAIVNALAYLQYYLHKVTKQ